MISSGRHPKKEIAEALRRAHDVGLLVREVHRGHRWGEVICELCPARRDVYSTPRQPGTHAKQIDRFVNQHIHGKSQGSPTAS